VSGAINCFSCANFIQNKPNKNKITREQEQSFALVYLSKLQPHATSFQVAIVKLPFLFAF
jgi:hypothetical protein